MLKRCCTILCIFIYIESNLYKLLRKRLPCDVIVPIIRLENQLTIVARTNYTKLQLPKVHGLSNPYFVCISRNVPRARDFKYINLDTKRQVCSNI